MTTTYTLQISRRDAEDRVYFETVGGAYATITGAMKAAKKFAGRGAEFDRDYVSAWYAGPNGTVYLIEEDRRSPQGVLLPSTIGRR